MEIISCVSSNSKNYYKSRRTGILPILQQIRTIKLPQRHINFRKNYTHAIPITKQIDYSFSLQGSLISLGNVADFIIKKAQYIVFFIVCAFTPVAINGIYKTYLSFASPLVLENIPAQELEILNKAMADFALERVNEFDEYGNLLDEDGQSLIPTEMNFRQPISYRTYTVQSGDTILGITRKFGLSNISTLIGINNISNVRQLKAGQTLRIPSVDGLTYTVKSGDNLNALSVRYQVTVEDLLDVNDLDSQTLSVGTNLFIPGARLSSESLRNAMGELFIYPLSGAWRLTSPFGRRQDPFTKVWSSHTGIDMAMPTGTPVMAAMSGKVATVGYTNIYGNYVIINHGNGYQTLYAHLSKTLVKTGQSINQGTRLGLVGSTGYSTGPHLHFTVYKNGKLVDPMTVLKK